MARSHLSHEAPWASLEPRGRHVLASTLSANALLFFDQTAVTVALPSIGRHFGVEGAQVVWVVTAYLLALTVGMSVAGRVADTVGRRRTYLVGLGLFGAGTAACALAPGFAPLVAARVLQGLGGAVLQPLALGATTEVVPDEHRGWAIGVLSTGGTSFLALGPLLAGLVLAVGSWRWIFVVTMPVLALSAVEAVRWMRPGRALAPAPLPAASALLLLAGLGASVVGVTQLASWPAGVAVPLLAAGVALLVGFAWRELHLEHPLLPLRALGQRPLRACLAALFTIQFIVLGLTVHLVLLLEHAFAVGALAAGGLLALSGLGTPLLSMTTGRLTDRHGARHLVVGGLLLAAAGLAWLAATAPELRVALLVPGLVAVSLARPAVFTPAGVAPTRLLPAAQRAVAASLVTESRQLGAVLGVAVLGPVAAAVGGTPGTASPADQADGFAAAVAVGAALAVAAALVAARGLPAGEPPPPDG